MSIGKNTKRIFTLGAGLAVAMLSGLGVGLERGQSQKNQLVSSLLKTEFRQTEQQPAHNTSDYDRLLRTYVNEQGWVDYAGLARERVALNRFLEQIANVSPGGLKDSSERLAFWINAYNACTLADVLDTVYGKHKSVRQASGFFDGKRRLVAGGGS